MLKKLIVSLSCAAMVLGLLTACGGSAAPAAPVETEAPVQTEEPAPVETEAPVEETSAPVCPLEDGVYTAEFITDSTMFHVNEVYEDKGVLTVKDGEMTMHVTLAGKGVLQLFIGTAEEAQKEGAVLLEHTVDEVTYPDGITDEVYGFDIPVPVLEEEFDCALYGKKGNWYDHKVYVTNVQSAETVVSLADGEYSAEVALEGGSGKAKVASPAKLIVKDGEVTAEIIWSSKNYDFMMVGDERYDALSNEEGSVFVIPVSYFDAPMAVQADTTAMGNPHLIDYTLTFNSTTIADGAADQ